MAGFVTSRLERMRTILAEDVERGEVPGLVSLVSRGNEVHVHALGTLRVDETTPMQHDTIFRIASLTKVIVAAAAMILIEDCAMRLNDPVQRWLPELADRRVLQSISSELSDTVPARRAITVRDVMTYCMGFGSVMAAPDTFPIQRAIREQVIGGDRPVLPTEFAAPDEWLRRLGSLPLMAQPGERWMYHVSGDVLGVLLGRVSGKPLSAFLEERLLGPLGMNDTAFSVPADKMDRLAGLYTLERQTNRLKVVDGGADGAWAAAPAFESGGGGLVSTADDYFAFCRMLLNGGRHGKEQILSRAAIALMTNDQLTAAQREGAEIFFGDFSSWGLGVAVDTQPREVYHSPGRYGWAGGYGTTAYTSPRENVIGILLTQRMMDSPEPPRVFTDFWTLAYGALE